MQLSFEPAAIDRGGALVRWGLESPTLAIGLCVLGVVAAAVTGGKRSGRAGLVAGIAAVLAGIGLGVAQWMVVTDREAISRRARSLVAAAAEGERGAMAELLREDARLEMGRWGGIGVRDARGSAAIIDLAQRRAGLADRTDGVRWRVEEVRAEVRGERGQTQVRVWAREERSGLAAQSWWRLGWVREAGVWRVIDIEPLWMQGL